MAKIKILKVINKYAVSKNGKQYIQCSIKTLDKNGQEVWINGFGNNTTKGWSDGQEVELDIYQEEYQGQIRLKFRDVKEINLAQEISEIKKLVKEIYAIVTFEKLDKPAKVSDVVEKLDEEEKIDTAGIPF